MNFYRELKRLQKCKIHKSSFSSFEELSRMKIFLAFQELKKEKNFLRWKENVFKSLFLFSLELSSSKLSKSSYKENKLESIPVNVYFFLNLEMAIFRIKLLDRKWTQANATKRRSNCWQYQIKFERPAKWSDDRKKWVAAACEIFKPIIYGNLWIHEFHDSRGVNRGEKMQHISHLNHLWHVSGERPKDEDQKG